MSATKLVQDARSGRSLKADERRIVRHRERRERREVCRQAFVEYHVEVAEDRREQEQAWAEANALFEELAWEAYEEERRARLDEPFEETSLGYASDGSMVYDDLAYDPEWY